MTKTQDAVTPENIEVGDYLQELLVTDTVVYLVTAKSKSGATVTLRRCGHGETVRNDNIDGNPFPVNYCEAVALEPMVPSVDEDASDYRAQKAHCDMLNERLDRIVRFRKDGTLRTDRSMNPLRFALTMTKADGTEVPVTRTDYRY